MKVILNQTVPKVGKEGQVVNVADGFARNYLFPRGLAVYADRSQLKAHDRRMERLVAKEAGTVSSAEQLKEKLDGKSVRIEGKVGKDTGKLFGAITSQNIVDAVKEQLKVSIDKRNVALIEPIKRLGHHQVHLDLHRQVDAFIDVTVFDPSMPEETEAEVLSESIIEEAPAEAPAEAQETAAPAKSKKKAEEPAEAAADASSPDEAGAGEAPEPVEA
jgi:large subunit ribosomal protein L9